MLVLRKVFRKAFRKASPKAFRKASFRKAFRGRQATIARAVQCSDLRRAMHIGVQTSEHDYVLREQAIVPQAIMQIYIQNTQIYKIHKYTKYLYLYIYIFIYLYIYIFM